VTTRAGAVGVHILADLYGVDSSTLCDGVALERLLCQAARDAGAQVLNCHFHSFGEGGGITGVVLLAESHISIHTWPEVQLAALDIFMCGSTDGKRALNVVIGELAPADSRIKMVERGLSYQPLPRPKTA
jgi:S-adenosylmethionine decarboxylase